MSTFKWLLCFWSGMASISLTAPASAATVSVTYGQMFSSQPGSSTTDFDSSLSFPLGFRSTGDNVGIAPGGISYPGRYAPPTGDDTNYAFVGDASTLTENFDVPISYFGIYWGSPDAYNTLTLTDMDLQSFSYSPGTGPLAALDPDSSNAAFVTFIDTGVAWTSVEFTSSAPAFEIDNLASSVSTPSPEPASIVLLGGGLLAVGVLRRRKIRIPPCTSE